MTDDYKKGLVTGLAMQPLYVAPCINDTKRSFTESMAKWSVYKPHVTIKAISGEMSAELTADAAEEETT